MKSKEEILQEIITSEGLKTWEAHTDKFNRMIAIRTMDKYAEQKAIAFKDWCTENEDDKRLENMNTGNPSLTTPKLYEIFKAENESKEG